VNPSHIRRAAVAFVVLGAIGVPMLFADEISTDTYIDSYDATQYGLTKNSDVNYGSSAATKVVNSAGSTMYPLATSDVHTLLTLPSSFWNAIGTSTSVTASVSFRIRNFNNNNAQPALFTDSVGLYPLTQTFSAGTGGSASSTQGGTENNAGGNGAIGADWFTSDGTTPWSTPGGTYDAADGVVVNVSSGALPTPTSGLFPTQSAADTYITWDISSLIDNPTTRAEIENNGLLAKIVGDDTFPAAGTQQFLSFYSIDGAGSDVASQPSVFYSVGAPEPASLGILGLGAAALLARRKHKEI
jgi:hypothetical protein